MQITSSVGGFSVYGTHNFNEDYSYHVRILLSEILSKKARTRNKNNTEFGQVADDGLGKTTIPLKLESKNGKFNVDYDFGQSKEIIQESISQEKQNLKGILNEEYGWYKEDTITKKQESKPKFSISWEEGNRLPHHAGALARIAEGFNQRLRRGLAAIAPLVQAEGARQAVANRCAEAEALDALRRPVGGDGVTAHAPDLFGIGLEEYREQPLPELVAHPLVECFRTCDGEGAGLDVGGHATHAFPQAEICDKASKARNG